MDMSMLIHKLKLAIIPESSTKLLTMAIILKFILELRFPTEVPLL